MEDAGATLVAEGLPCSINETGLVDFGFGDREGVAILQ